MIDDIQAKWPPPAFGRLRQGGSHEIRHLRIVELGFYAGITGRQPRPTTVTTHEQPSRARCKGWRNASGRLGFSRMISGQN
jgi:hypothetical protein